MAMVKKRILSVFGTRSEATNLFPILLEMKRSPALESFVCVTAQQRHPLDQVLKLFDIQPDFDLNLLRPEQSAQELLSRVITKLDPVFKEVKPDLVVVQGHSVTAVAASLAASYNRVPLAHVGAGLRAGNMQENWPAEGNGKLVSALAAFHFCPTAFARDNLLAEGVAEENIHVTGSPAVDGVVMVNSLLQEGSKAYESMRHHFPFLQQERQILLVACDRLSLFENDVDGFKDFILHVTEQAAFLDVVVVSSYCSVLEESFRKNGTRPANLFLSAPLDYLPFVYLMKRSCYILTNSGTIQDEAPTLGVPVMIMRSVNERKEAVSSGIAVVVGADVKKIGALLEQMKKQSNDETAENAAANNPFGSGNAADVIVRIIAQ